ncbi:MAG: DNA alkylation repair protein [Rickettsiales bacterium]|jgi:3-methyladenine DNA glycosylase AlkD|nr:DNA alkylation repair protein [Rickettsiales bacterium]
MTMDPLNFIEQNLLNGATEANRIAMKRYFREEINSYGVKSAEVKRIARNVLVMLRGGSREKIFDLCEELWRSGYIEKCDIACELAYSLRESYIPNDFWILERWVGNYLGNWANCDSLCNHSVGSFIEKYPEFLDRLKLWTKSENRWKKRASAVSLIVPARRGLFLATILAIAESLLEDRDDMVQKGYGWMLKAASEAYPNEVFDFLMVKRDVMPRTAFRYALEKLSPELKKIAMKR